MNAYKLDATLNQDGTLVLEGLPFHAGDTVEVIIVEQSKKQLKSAPLLPEYPLQGKQPYRYDDPFGSVVDEDYLDAVAGTLTEWNSEADELAYQNL